MTLTDAIPPQVVAPITYTINGVPQGAWTGTVQFNNMGVGAPGAKTVTITGRVACDAVNFSNTATVALAPPYIDPDLNNNTATWATSIINALAITGTVTNTSCPGFNDGSINITVTGGTLPYSYLWTASGGGIVPAGQANNEDLTGLVAGTYMVNVTDGNGCNATQSFVVGSDPDTEPPTFTPPGNLEFCVNIYRWMASWNLGSRALDWIPGDPTA